MFTGLIVEMGEVTSLAARPGGARLALKAVSLARDARLGDSIAINGTCLTVVEIKGDILSFDLSDETLKTTNLGELNAKEKVNLEPSLRPDSKLGGHFVTGHIDGIGKIQSRSAAGDMIKIFISAGRRLTDFLVQKGSVAVDGVSLTVVDAMPDGFSIVIIPHTAHMTTVGLKHIGSSVNIEVDILGKYVSKFLAKGREGTFMQTLVDEGFARDL